MSARSTKQRRAARRRRQELRAERFGQEWLRHIFPIPEYQRAFVEALLSKPSVVRITWGRRGPMVSI